MRFQKDELAAANAMIEALRSQCKTQLDAVPGIVASARADALAESAAETSKLRAENERLRGALKPLAWIADMEPASKSGLESIFVALRLLREARAALAQKEE